MLAIWKAYKSGSGSQAWCREHFLVGRHLTFAAEIRKQLVGLCRGAEISMESSRDLDNVRKALAHGLFMNVAQLTTEGHWVALDSGQKCHIHPQSVLFRSKPEVVVYTEMVHTSKTYLKVSSASCLKCHHLIFSFLPGLHLSGRQLVASVPAGLLPHSQNKVERLMYLWRLY